MVIKQDKGKKRTDITRLFVKQVIIFTAAIVLVSVGFSFFYQYKQLKTTLLSNLDAEIRQLASQINTEILLAQEQVKALSSRTMIRKNLFNYYKGEWTLEQIREYTQPKYIDGASVYGNIIAAWRTDLQGNIIAEYTPSHFKLEDFNDYASLHLFMLDGDYRLFIRNPIVQQDIYIGYDNALIDFTRTFDFNLNFAEELRMSHHTPPKDIDAPLICSASIGINGCYISARLKKTKIKEGIKDILSSIFLISALLILAVLLISYFTLMKSVLRLIREREDYSALLQKTTDERRALLKELNHRVKNNLNLINSFISMQTLNSMNPETIDSYKVLQNKIEAINVVHNLLQVQEDSLDIELGTYMKTLGDHIIQLNTGDKIYFNMIESEKVYFAAKKIITLGLLVSELITNSIKHARENSVLDINLEILLEKNHFKLIYSDTGSPFPKDFQLENFTNGGLGMIIIQQLTNQLEGTMELIPEKKNFIFTFPVS